MTKNTEKKTHAFFEHKNSANSEGAEPKKFKKVFRILKVQIVCQKNRNF